MAMKPKIALQTPGKEIVFIGFEKLGEAIRAQLSRQVPQDHIKFQLTRVVYFHKVYDFLTVIGCYPETR